MKGFEKEKKKTPNPYWAKIRFYVLIVVSTAILISILSAINHGERLPETLYPAGISLLNAVVAYIISKRDQANRDYKKMMNQVKVWMIVRFVVMALLLVALILTKTVEALPFIFTFIGFYILHQVIEITVMQKEIN